MINEKPMHRHTCEDCKYLGPYQNADLYVCGVNSKFPVILARFSNDYSDYSCVSVKELENCKNDDFLVEAERRAIEGGFIEK